MLAPMSQLAFPAQQVSSGPMIPWNNPKPVGMWDWYRSLNLQNDPASTPMASAVTGLRHNAEGAIVGALLAFVDTDLGGLDLGGKYPLDWISAAAFYGMSIRDSGRADGLASDYRAISQSCTTVAAFRTMHRWREARKGLPEGATEKESGDPIAAAAKRMGL